MQDRSAEINALLAKRILILDGAYGTMLQQHQLTEADFRGERFRDWPQDVKGNNDLLSLTQPQLIADLHRQYLQAGADIIETNTFSANRISMADYAMTRSSPANRPTLFPPPPSRVLSLAASGRPTVPLAFHPMSMTRGRAIPISTNWSHAIKKRPAR